MKYLYSILVILVMCSAVPVKDKSGIMFHVTSPSKTIITYATDGKDTLYAGTGFTNSELTFIWIPRPGKWIAEAASPGYLPARDTCNCELGFFEHVYLTIDTIIDKKKDD